MSQSQLAYLELLAEVDGLLANLQRWAEQAPPWDAAQGCLSLVRRLNERAHSLRVRLEAPLVVATLGGTGTGKSTLVNALVGAEVSTAGRRRPTTCKPTLICAPHITPANLGIDAAAVELVHRELPLLRDVVLLDCPDPDTTEEDEVDAGTNLARLRSLLPHCDVLLVASTQQKYRSARVRDELFNAAAMTANARRHRRRYPRRLAAASGERLRSRRDVLRGFAVGFASAPGGAAAGWPALPSATRAVGAAGHRSGANYTPDQLKRWCSAVGGSTRTPPSAAAERTPRSFAKLPALVDGAHDLLNRRHWENRGWGGRRRALGFSPFRWWRFSQPGSRAQRGRADARSHAGPTGPVGRVRRHAEGPRHKGQVQSSGRRRDCLELGRVGNADRGHHRRRLREGRRPAAARNAG